MKATKDYRVEHIKAKDAERPDRNEHLHVTDLNSCPIGVWLQKTGRARPEINESKLRRFDAGHNIEERVIEAYKHAEVLKDEQVGVSWEEYNMVGSADAIIDDGHGLWLVEVKSIHTYGISHLYRSNKVHDHYLEQIMLYWSKLKQRPEYKDKLGARIYYEALDGRTFEQKIEWDEQICLDALKKAERLHQAISANEPPEGLETFVEENGKMKLNWKVKYCIESGMHYKCATYTAEDVLSIEPAKWISKLEYQAKKLNK